LSVAVPRLETPRLILRAFSPSDVEPYARMMAEPAVCRFLGDGKPLARSDAWRQLAQLIGHWELRGFGLWAVEERATACLIGRIGCYEPDGWPGFEIGYALAREAWGRGYAREGVAAALAYARRELGRAEIISLIRPDNRASIAVAEHFGAHRTHTMELFGAASDVYTYPLSG
jgi:RimJ/RimL family protein N-acetyltransferase